MATKNFISKQYSEDELRVMFEQFKQENLSYQQIAEKLFISSSTVAKYVKRFGLSQDNELSLSVETVAQLYDDGLTANEIAHKFGVSHDSITRRLHKAGRKINRADNIKKHFSRTHDEIWSDIEHDLNMGMSKTAISAKYHIRLDNVDRLIRQKRYSREFVGDVSEVETILASADDIKNPKFRTSVKLYMTALLNYVNDYKILPTVTNLAKYMNIPIQTVAWWFKQHNYTRLLSRGTLSSQVKIVEKTLLDMSIVYEINNRRLIAPYEIDFWLYELNTGIEVNPATTHCANPDRKMHKVECCAHQKKALECWHRGIRLIQLYDWDVFRSDFANYLAKFLPEWTNFSGVKEITIDLDKPFCHKSDLLANGFVELRVNAPSWTAINANTYKITDEYDKQALFVYDSGSITYIRK